MPQLHRFLFCFPLILSLILLPGLSLRASSIAQVDTRQLLHSAQLVFQGEVLDRRSEQAADGRIYTFVDFQVEEVLVGTQPEGSVLTLRFTGGQVGDRRFSVGVDIPEVGEKGIYFVESVDTKLINPLLGWSQGRFRIQPDSSLVAGNGERVVGFDGVDAAKGVTLSHGVARGVKTRPASLLNARGRGVEPAKAMTVDQFKRKIRELLQ
jgi:hypothetical protein